MDNKLPAEVLEEIKAYAEAKTDNAAVELRRKDMEYAAMIMRLFGYKDGLIEAATEYAIKLHETKYSFYKLDESARAMAEEYARLNNSHHAARALLEKVTSRHEAGLLPDRFIYDEIKNFLDGK